MHEKKQQKLVKLLESNGSDTIVVMLDGIQTQGWEKSEGKRANVSAWRHSFRAWWLSCARGSTWL